MDSLLPELQFLGTNHHREPDLGILKTLVETVYIISGKVGKEVRMQMKEMGAYLVVRELHLDIEDDEVRAACEKVVDVLMVDHENGEASGEKSEKEEKARVVTESSDGTGAQKPITEAKSSEIKLALSEKERSLQLAKPPSDPPSTAPVSDKKDEVEADDDENRIIEIF